MSAPRFFDAARAYKRELTGKRDGLTQADVDALNAATVGRWTAPVASQERRGEPKAAEGYKPASTTKGALTAIIGAVAATSLFTTIPEDEGYKLAAYRDIAGIPTICMGDTRNVRMGMVETPEGCVRRLEAQLVAHAKPVMQCSPRLKEPGRDWQRAAAVSLAYNIGVGAYCRSTVDRRFDAGDWRGGCDAFLRWNKARVNGKLRPVKGLTLRRQREREICLRGVET